MQIGYFNRPLSTAIFLLLIFILYTLYFILLLLVKEKKIDERKIWLLIGLTIGVLIFSYPAFSHDIFNYMFWARIATYYNLSPYQFKPLDFPDDSWIRFMHWTHVTYNHGPVFLLLSLIPSFLGFNKFLLILVNFKLLFSLSFLGSAYLIRKIIEKIKPENKVFALTFFAFNPLIIIESLVSAHNDILMLFFALISFYLLMIRKNLLSVLTLLVSVGVKFLTVSFLPLYLLTFFSKKVNWPLLLKMIITFFLISLIPAIGEREPYPWYFVSVIGLASLVVNSRFIRITIIGLSLGLLMRYAPFLYFGDYQSPVPTLTFWLTIAPLILSIIVWSVTRKEKP
jgi:hypothetical protein